MNAEFGVTAEHFSSKRVLRKLAPVGLATAVSLGAFGCTSHKTHKEFTVTTQAYSQTITERPGETLYGDQVPIGDFVSRKNAITLECTVQKNQADQRFIYQTVLELDGVLMEQNFDQLPSVGSSVSLSRTIEGKNINIGSHKEFCRSVGEDGTLYDSTRRFTITE